MTGFAVLRTRAGPTGALANSRRELFFLSHGRWTARLLAVIAGLLAAFAQPPWGFVPGLLGYGLMFLLADRAVTRSSAFARSWQVGVAYFVVSLWWLAEPFQVDAKNQGWMAPFAVIFTAMFMALFWGAAGAAFRELKGRSPARVSPVRRRLVCLRVAARAHPHRLSLGPAGRELAGGRTHLADRLGGRHLWPDLAEPSRRRRFFRRPRGPARPRRRGRWSGGAARASWLWEFPARHASAGGRRSPDPHRPGRCEAGDQVRSRGLRRHRRPLYPPHRHEGRRDARHRDLARRRDPRRLRGLPCPRHLDPPRHRRRTRARADPDPRRLPLRPGLARHRRRLQQPGGGPSAARRAEGSGALRQVSPGAVRRVHAAGWRRLAYRPQGPRARRRRLLGGDRARPPSPSPACRPCSP